MSYSETHTVSFASATHRPTYGEGVNFLKDYLTERSDFLTYSFALDEPPKPRGPFVAENFYYMVMNKQTSNVIDVTGQSAEVNAKLMLWGAVEGRLTQQWKILPVSDSAFQFVNRFSGLAMKSGGWTKNLIQVQPDSNSTDQQWKILPESTGTAFRIDNVRSGYTADCSGGSSANGTAVIEFDIKTSGTDNQYWYIQKVEMVETGLDRTEVSSVIIYPNPVNEILYVSADGGFSEGTILEVISAYGRTLIRQRAEGMDSRIDVANLPNGLYLLRISIGNIQYIKKLFIVHSGIQNRPFHKIGLL